MAKRFSLKGQWPVLEFNWKRGPIILIKTGDRHLELKQANRIEGKFVLTKYGVFELDGEHEYRLSNNSLYIFNLHNAKPVSIQGIEKIQSFYRNKQASLIVKELAMINAALKEHSDPLEAMEIVFEKNKAQTNISQDDIKFLIDYRTYYKDDVGHLILDRMDDKNPLKGMSGSVTAYFPILIFAGIGIGITIFLRFFNPLKIFGIGI